MARRTSCNDAAEERDRSAKSAKVDILQSTYAASVSNVGMISPQHGSQTLPVRKLPRSTLEVMAEVALPRKSVPCASQSVYDLT